MPELAGCIVAAVELQEKGKCMKITDAWRAMVSILAGRIAAG